PLCKLQKIVEVGVPSHRQAASSKGDECTGTTPSFRHLWRPSGQRRDPRIDGRGRTEHFRVDATVRDPDVRKSVGEVAHETRGPADVEVAFDRRAKLAQYRLVEVSL